MEVAAALYVPPSFDSGEADQFDWSYVVIVIEGVTTIITVAQVRLCHSRMIFVRTYPRETQEMVFDARNKIFAFLGDTCARERLRAYADRGRYDLRRQRSLPQPALLADVPTLPD